MLRQILFDVLYILLPQFQIPPTNLSIIEMTIHTLLDGTFGHQKFVESFKVIILDGQDNLLLQFFFNLNSSILITLCFLPLQKQSADDHPNGRQQHQCRDQCQQADFPKGGDDRKLTRQRIAHSKGYAARHQTHQQIHHIDLAEPQLSREYQPAYYEDNRDTGKHQSAVQ